MVKQGYDMSLWKAVLLKLECYRREDKEGRCKHEWVFCPLLLSKCFGFDWLSIVNRGHGKDAKYQVNHMLEFKTQNSVGHTFNGIINYKKASISFIWNEINLLLLWKETASHCYRHPGC